MNQVKPKVGDRVKILDGADLPVRAGTLGTIKTVGLRGIYSVVVDGSDGIIHVLECEMEVLC